MVSPSSIATVRPAPAYRRRRRPRPASAAACPGPRRRRSSGSIRLLACPAATGPGSRSAARAPSRRPEAAEHLAVVEVGEAGADPDRRRTGRSAWRRRCSARRRRRVPRVPAAPAPRRRRRTGLRRRGCGIRPHARRSEPAVRRRRVESGLTWARVAARPSLPGARAAARPPALARALGAAARGAAASAPPPCESPSTCAAEATSRWVRSAALGTASTLSRWPTWISTSVFMPGRSSPSRLSIRTSTGNIVTFCSVSRLRLDLEHRALERPVGVRIHRDRRELARLDLADVGLVHQRPDLHEVEVGHLEQRGAAAHVRRGRGDHLPALDVLLDDRAGDRRADVGVLELDLALSTATLRSHHLRRSRWRSRAAPGSCSCSVIDWRLEQLVGPPLLRWWRWPAGPAPRRGPPAPGRACCARCADRCGPAGAPRFTSWPVSALSWRTSPEAFDFTSTVVSGWMAPDAWADTTMSRCSTGTAW